MVKNVLMSTVSITVGICALAVLDAQLGNLDYEEFKKMVKNKYLRALTLFATAYAANGNNLLTACLGVYIYFLVIEDDCFDAYFSGLFKK